MKSHHRLCQLATALALVTGFVLLLPQRGESQGFRFNPMLRGNLPNRFSPVPYLGIPNLPNFQPMLAMGGMHDGRHDGNDGGGMMMGGGMGRWAAA